MPAGGNPGAFERIGRMRRGIMAIAMLCALGMATTAGAEEAQATPAKDAASYKPRLGGYVEGWYRADSSDLSSQTTAAKKTDNEFRVRRARLDGRGDLTDELSYRATINLDGPSPASSSASVKLWDGYLAYKANELATVTVGQFKYDFSLEGYEGTPDRLPVLRAEAVNDIAAKLGTQGGSFRDIGARVSGGVKDLYGLTYGVSIINGAGINKGDNNADKDIVGKVAFKPVEGLSVGASAYLGKGQDETASTEVDESAWGLEAEYKISGLTIRGEYIAANWENWDVSTSSVSSGKTQEPSGWYLQAAYKLPQAPSVELMARYEDYEKDANTEDSRLKTTTLGATYYLKGKTRLTANYLMRDAGDSSVVTAQETDATGSKIGDLFLVQAILVF